MHRLALNSISLSAGLGFAQALTALAYWVTARELTPSAFGEVAAYVGIAMLLSAAADFGFNSWVVRELARAGSVEMFTTSLGVRIAIAAFAGLLWIAATGAIWLVGIAPAYAPVLGVWIGFSLLWSTLLAPLRASERMSRVAVVTAIERIVLAAVVAVGIAANTPALALVVGLGVGSVIASGIALRLIDPSMRRARRPRLKEIRSFLRSSLGFALSSFAQQVQRVDVALVGAVAGSFSAGIYAAPARLTNALGILPTAFSASLFPRASREEGSIWTRDFRRGVALLLALMLVVTVPLFLFAAPLTVALLGEPYRASAEVLRVILGGMLLATVNQPLATALQARGHEYFVAATIAVSATLGLIAIAIGAYVAGPTGGAFGFVVLQLAILGALLMRTVARLSTNTQAKRVVTPARL